VPRRKFCGVWREKATIWAIYSLCGVPVRTVFWWRPDARCLGKEQNGYARPDELNYPFGWGWQLTSGRGTDSVWTPERRPVGLQKGNHPNCRTPPVRTPRGTVRTLYTKNTRKTEENFTEIKFFQDSVRTCMYNQLITQSDSISKLNRDIKESFDFN
jgi:hypothetical protein